jgi:hypothetical protein
VPTIADILDAQTSKAAQSDKYLNIKAELDSKIEEVFQENCISVDKFKECIGKNSETFAAEVYGDEVTLDPQAFISFLTAVP